MDNIEKTTEQVLDNTAKSIKPLLDNKVIALVISSIILLNIIHSLDSLPKTVKDVLLNDITKIVSIFASIYYVNGSLKNAIIWTIALVALYKAFFFIKENFEVITQTSDVYPGCTKATAADLLSLYNGDVTALRKGMYEIGVPLNIDLNDTNAPLIATYFVNHGKKVSDGCRQPE